MGDIVDLHLKLDKLNEIQKLYNARNAYMMKELHKKHNKLEKQSPKIIVN